MSSWLWNLTYFLPLGRQSLQGGSQAEEQKSSFLWGGEVEQVEQVEQTSSKLQIGVSLPHSPSSSSSLYDRETPHKTTEFHQYDSWLIFVKSINQMHLCPHIITVHFNSVFSPLACVAVVVSLSQFAYRRVYRCRLFLVVSTFGRVVSRTSFLASSDSSPVASEPWSSTGPVFRLQTKGFGPWSGRPPAPCLSSPLEQRQDRGILPPFSC